MYNLQFAKMSELAQIVQIELNSHNLLTSKNGLKSSKQLKMIFLFMSVLNTLQYKQCLCILTLPKHNLQTRFSQFTDQKKVSDGTNNINRTFHK